MGHINTNLSFLGLNWAFKIGDGNRHLIRHSAVTIFHMAILLSNPAETSLCPLRDQLRRDFDEAYISRLHSSPSITYIKIRDLPNRTDRVTEMGGKILSHTTS